MVVNFKIRRGVMPTSCLRLSLSRYEDFERLQDRVDRANDNIADMKRLVVS